MAISWVLPTGTDGATTTTTGEGGSTAVAGSHFYRAAAAYPGRSVGLSWEVAASAASSSRWLLLDGTSQSQWVRMTIVTPSVTPNVDASIARLRGADATTAGFLIYTATGNLAFAAKSGGTLTVMTGAALSTHYDVSFLVTMDTAAGTTGSYTVTVYTQGTSTSLGSLTRTGNANLGTSPLAGFDIGALTALTSAYTVGMGVVGYESGRTTEGGPYAIPSNAIPTITPAGPINVPAGTTTATITGSGDDSDGTIANFTCAYRAGTSTLQATPTVSAVTITSGAGTNHATYSFTISNLGDGKGLFDVYAIDNAGASSLVGTAQINKTQLAPARTAVTLTGVTKITPSTGSNSAALNNQAAVPVVFETASPPAGGANMVEVFQPLDASASAPYFGQWWAIKNDGTTIVPTTVYVDLVEGSTTRATASAVISGYTPVFVGRSCTAPEAAAIVDRANLSVVGRFA